MSALSAPPPPPPAPPQPITLNDEYIYDMRTTDNQQQHGQLFKNKDYSKSKHSQFSRCSSKSEIQQCSFAPALLLTSQQTSLSCSKFSIYSQINDCDLIQCNKRTSKKKSQINDDKQLILKDENVTKNTKEMNGTNSCYQSSLYNQQQSKKKSLSSTDSFTDNNIVKMHDELNNSFFNLINNVQSPKNFLLINNNNKTFNKNNKNSVTNNKCDENLNLTKISKQHKRFISLEETSLLKDKNNPLQNLKEYLENSETTFTLINSNSNVEIFKSMSAITTTRKPNNNIFKVFQCPKVCLKTNKQQQNAENPSDNTTMIKRKTRETNSIREENPGKIQRFFLRSSIMRSSTPTNFSLSLASKNSDFKKPITLMTKENLLEDFPSKKSNLKKCFKMRDYKINNNNSRDESLAVSTITKNKEDWRRHKCTYDNIS